MLPSLNIYCFRVNFNEIVIVISQSDPPVVGLCVVYSLSFNALRRLIVHVGPGTQRVFWQNSRYFGLAVNRTEEVTRTEFGPSRPPFIQ